MTVSFREKLLAIALMVSLAMSVGYALAQSLEFVGRGNIVGIFQKRAVGLDPLEFTPQLFNVGTILESSIENFSLQVRNPNARAINITWTASVNQTIPITIWLFLDEVVFENSTFIEIQAGQTLTFRVQIESNACDIQCPAAQTIPFKIDIIFSGIAGSPPGTGGGGTAELPIQIRNIETIGGNGTILYNATYLNIGSQSLQLDTIVRRNPRNTPPDGEALDLQSSRLTIAPNANETISGNFNVRGLTGNVYQVQFEALTLPPGQPLADVVRVDVVMLSDPPAAIAAEFIPAGEPEDFVPEGEIGEPIGEIETIGGIIPIPVDLLPALILMTIIVVASVIGVLWARRSKTAKSKPVGKSESV